MRPHDYFHDAARAGQKANIINVLYLLELFPKRAVELLRGNRGNLDDLPGEMLEVLYEDLSKSSWADKFQRWEEQGIGAVSILDEHYPEKLLFMPDPPVVLYFKGELSALMNRSVSIVGARHADRSGTELSFEFGFECARNELSVVSGLALGIDGAAHKGALKAAGAPTVAVLANGVDRCYPPTHRSIYEDILETGGCIISEYLPGSNPYPVNFLERNRIIAALSEVLVVIQAAKRSGSLRTANAALEYGKDVAAIPWNITNRRGEGCNRLLKNGAHLLTCIDDLFELMELKRGFVKGRSDVGAVSENEARVLEILFEEPEVHIDELKKRSFATELEIVNLEILGLITRSYGNMIRRSGG